MEEQFKSIIVSALKEAIMNGTIPSAAAPTQESPWRDAAGIAEYLGFTVQWVRTHMMHLAHKPGGSDPRWNITEVDQWARMSAHNPRPIDLPIEANISKRSKHIKHETQRN
jgi:hypothetical protein